jgi:hypothetical protein
MNLKRKNIGTGLVGLLLLSACEQDFSAGEGAVAITFTTTTAGYDAGEEEVRGLDLEEGKPEPTVVALGNDLYLYARLEPDTVEETGLDGSQMRSDELRLVLENNQRVRLAAFKPDGTQEGLTTTYTYTGGKLVPDGGIPLGVEPGATVYRFAAYSYFGDKANDPVETNILPEKDLVWGHADKPIPNTYTGREVSITMKHKFARVRVQIDAHTIATAIPSITGARIVGGKTADLTNIKEGTVEATATDANQEIIFPGTGNVLTSDYYMYYPTVTGVRFDNIVLTIGGVNKPFSTISALFNKDLEAGKSYSLVVDIRKLVWAKSNIYWDTGTHKPMFSESGNSNHQGIFFVFGSLIGLSGGVHDTWDPTLYIPNVAAGTWDDTKKLSSSIYNANIHNIPTQNPGWGGIQNNPDFENYKGDICSYLTDYAWRMPSLAEFGAATDYSSWVSGTLSGLNAAGTGTITSGVTNNVLSLFFPASGFYNGSMDPAGRMTNPGGVAYYYAGGGGMLSLISTGVDIRTSTMYSVGASVRCVK